VTDRKDEGVSVFYDAEVRSNDGARLIKVGEREVWIPKSQIRKNRLLHGKNGPVHELVIPRWLAEDRELL